MSKQNRVAQTDTVNRLGGNAELEASRSFDGAASAAALRRMAPGSCREWQGSSQLSRIEAKLKVL